MRLCSRQSLSAVSHNDISHVSCALYNAYTVMVCNRLPDSIRSLSAHNATTLNDAVDHVSAVAAPLTTAGGRRARTVDLEVIVVIAPRLVAALGPRSSGRQAKKKNPACILAHAPASELATNGLVLRVNARVHHGVRREGLPLHHLLGHQGACHRAGRDRRGDAAAARTHERACSWLHPACSDRSRSRASRACMPCRSAV